MPRGLRIAASLGRYEDRETQGVKSSRPNESGAVCEACVAP